MHKPRVYIGLCQLLEKKATKQILPEASEERCAHAEATQNSGLVQRVAAATQGGALEPSRVYLEGIGGHGADHKVSNHVGFMTTAAEHFPYERPQQLSAQAASALQALEAEVVVAERLVVDPASAEAAAAQFLASGVDLLVSLCGSFTWDNMPVRVTQELNVPILLWGIPEPEMAGGRLEANSLVGVTMNAAALKRLGQQYKFVYGLPTDEAALAEIRRTIRVIGALKGLRHARLDIVGGRPPGFYGSTYDELDLRRAIGVEVIPIEISEVLAAYEWVPEADVDLGLARVTGLGRRAGATEDDLRRVSRLYAGMKSIIQAERLSAIAVKWLCGSSSYGARSPSRSWPGPT